ncbi:hypothetical protein D1BOALGB6SA_6938 [Olavius sp. associated proteobacterium Delta 1]|nr:hypothetical protein D1BOALGB6SA_6938 [Olavius sp. associated proteobacterium Delta 1]
MEKINEWEYIEQEVWKPTVENSSIQGTLIGKASKDENFRSRYYIVNESGKYIVWGSAMLDNKMQFVEEGQVVRISYEGKSKSRQGQDIKNFTVAFQKAAPPRQCQETTNHPDRPAS